MTTIWVFVVTTKLLPERGRHRFFKSPLGLQFCSKFSSQQNFLWLNFSSSKSQMSGSRTWPQTIKNTILIVTCSITIIGTEESAVAQYLCCNPNWHSLECFGSKTRHRPEPRAACLGGSKLLLLETSSSGEVPMVFAVVGLGGDLPGVEVRTQSLAEESGVLGCA